MTHAAGVTAARLRADEDRYRSTEAGAVVGTKMRGYSALFAAPGVRRVGLPSVLARLPVGMTTLALLLLVQQSRDSFAIAGSATACFAVASGLSSPLRGRAVDRWGPFPVLAVTGVLQPMALVAVVAASADPANSAAFVLLASAASGALLPPVGPVARVLWQRLPTAELRTAAFSMDAVLLQVIYYGAGPPAVTGLVVLGSPALSVYVIAAVTLIGTLLVASAPAARGWPRGRRHPDLRGALAAPRLTGVLVVVLATAAAIGALEVAVTAYATQHGVGDLSGLLLAVLGIGSIAGGLWHGTRSGRAPASQYRWWLAALTVGFIPHRRRARSGRAGSAAVAGGAGDRPHQRRAVRCGRCAGAHRVGDRGVHLAALGVQAGSAAGLGLGGLVAEAAGARGALLLPVALAAGAFLLGLAGTKRIRRTLLTGDR